MSSSLKNRFPFFGNTVQCLNNFQHWHCLTLWLGRHLTPRLPGTQTLGIMAASSALHHCNNIPSLTVKAGISSICFLIQIIDKYKYTLYCLVNNVAINHYCFASLKLVYYKKIRIVDEEADKNDGKEGRDCFILIINRWRIITVK